MKMTINTRSISADFASAFGIGDPVWFNDGTSNGVRMPGHIRVVLFTAGKVRYSVRLEASDMTVHNVDSVAVEARPEGIKPKELPFDNYS